jgi:DNA repair exonuclease SbcCD ATPase subunit
MAVSARAQEESAEYHPVLDASDRATLSMGYEEHWVREDGSPAEEEQWATIGDEELAVLTASPDPAAHRALLDTADPQALQDALDEAARRIDRLAQSIPTLNRDIRRLRVQALRDSPKAKETRAEIKRLEEELEAYAESLPEIQTRRAAAESIHRNMMEELRFRREIERKLEQTKPSLEP